MIPDRESKIEKITETITTRMHKSNDRFRRGPGLYFYRRILELRRRCPEIGSFVSNDYYLEVLYALLVAWDMNSRRARLKYFDEFKSNILSCSRVLQEIEASLHDFHPANLGVLLDLLQSVFTKLALMESAAGRLVSNSKCLHFLFPSVCMPMDGSNTLRYLYGSTYESATRYREILAFSFEVMAKDIDFAQYLDDQWNQAIPKLVDNAIILLNEPSVN
jgi:hypothetical protein